jgi:sulfite exporter TauE/SafE
VNATLSAGAALLLGLAAGGHCLVMCGGITAALGIATAKDAAGRPRRTLLVAYQLGRIGSYVLAGLIFGSLAGGVVAIANADAVSRALRVLSAGAMLLAALVVIGRVHDPAARLGGRLWARLAPLGRRLLPVATPLRALAFGAVWGWMPCGFVYTVLLIATLQADPLHAALTMAAFGLGTLPVMLAASLGLARASALAMPRLSRSAAGFLLLAGAALTLAGSWLVPEQHGLHGLLPFGGPTH